MQETPLAHLELSEDDLVLMMYSLHALRQYSRNTEKIDVMEKRVATALANIPAYRNPLT